MSKQLITLPLSRVEAVDLYINKGKLTLAQIAAQARNSHPGLEVYVLNGGLYEGVRAVCHLKADGRVYAEDPYTYWGYAWDTGPDIAMAGVPSPGKRNYLCCVALLRGRKAERLIYNKDLGGSRQRSAMGLKGGALCLYCTNEGRTPEELQAELLALGWESAVMLDGGGSSQCDFNGQTIKSARKVHNLIIVYVRPEEGGKEDKPVNYIVRPDIGVNVRSAPGTDSPKVGGYGKGTVVAVLEERDGWGRTSLGWVKLSLLDAVDPPQEAERVTDNGVAIEASIIPKGRKNRPAMANSCACITIHETGNFAKGADAAAHASYLKGDDAEASRVSWHYTVDDHAIFQHLPDAESAYHAGDGPSGPGNTTSIGIEICVNAGGDFEKAKQNAAALVRLLRKEHGIPVDRVVQHHHWNGKDCPKTIRATPGAWEAFLEACGDKETVDTPAVQWGAESVQKAVAKGLIQGDEHGRIVVDEPMTLRQWCVLEDRAGRLD